MKIRNSWENRKNGISEQQRWSPQATYQNGAPGLVPEGTKDFLLHHKVGQHGHGRDLSNSSDGETPLEKPNGTRVRLLSVLVSLIQALLTQACRQVTSLNDWLPALNRWGCQNTNKWGDVHIENKRCPDGCLIKKWRNVNLKVSEQSFKIKWNKTILT